MDWDIIERNWKPFKSKVELLFNSLSDAHPGALSARRVDDTTNNLIGPQIKRFDSSRTRQRVPSIAGGRIRSGKRPAAATTVLFVEQEPGVSGLIQAGFADTQGGAFHVERVTRLTDALQRLGKGGVEVVMLDLTLPDGQGLEVFDQIIAAAPNALIFILTPADDEDLARQAVQRGAHDYFLKGHVDSHWLSRTLRYVVDGKATRGALLSSEARFRAISDASPLGIFVSDAQGSCVYTNAAYQRISGLSFEQALGTRWSMAIHPEDRQRVIDDWRAAAHSNAPLRAEFRFQRQDGSVVWTRVNSAAMGDGVAPHGYVQTVEDVTARKSTEFGLRKAEEALFEEKERAQVTLNSIGDAVLSTDNLGNITYLNLVAETMTGWSSEEALGRPFTEVFRIIDGKTRQTAVNPAQRALDEDRIVGLSADCVLIRRDGSESAIEDSAAPIHDRDGNVSGAVIVFHDVSQSRAMASKMAHQAKHDFLTDLPNRTQLMERLSQAIGLARRHGKQVALLFLDLDDFKRINDSLGHAIGDQLLQLVAERLLASVRSTDMVCRYGGDEFVILLDEIKFPQGADLVAETLITAFAAPHVIDQQELDVTLSIGISVYPVDGDNVDALIKNADTAMFHAKADGRNTYQFTAPT
ncbi:MAG: diguanylate cyclase [Gammaproteobacteria bacterium]|nr:diguanylate cyclase [Gammaproteobacteria bacterium]